MRYGEGSSEAKTKDPLLSRSSSSLTLGCRHSAHACSGGQSNPHKGGFSAYRAALYGFRSHSEAAQASQCAAAYSRTAAEARRPAHPRPVCCPLRLHGATGLSDSTLARHASPLLIPACFVAVIQWQPAPVLLNLDEHTRMTLSTCFTCAPMSRLTVSRLSAVETRLWQTGAETGRVSWFDGEMDSCSITNRSTFENMALDWLWITKLNRHPHGSSCWWILPARLVTC